MRTRVLFVSDLKGARHCVGALLNRLRFRPPQLLIWAGDFARKGLFPILRTANGFHLHDGKILTETQYREFCDAVAGYGQGYCVTLEDKNKFETLLDSLEARQAAFAELSRDALGQDLRELQSIAEVYRLRTVLIPGNSDPPSIDAAIQTHAGPYLRLVTEATIAVDDKLNFVVCSYAEQLRHGDSMAEGRDLPPAELKSRLTALFATLPYGGARRCIAYIRTPPLGLIQRSLLRFGSPGYLGSLTVAESIRYHRPAVSLHAQILECQNHVDLAGTVAVSSGSEYDRGVLNYSDLQFSNGELLPQGGIQQGQTNCLVTPRPSAEELLVECDAILSPLRAAAPTIHVYDPPLAGAELEPC